MFRGFLDGIVADYDFFRDHQAHKGDTRGQAARADKDLTEWQDIVDMVSAYKASIANPQSQRRRGEEGV